MKEFWDERYKSESFAYGTEPNDFLAGAVGYLKEHSKILSIGEGEGRNALFLARNGHSVTAVDQSVNGLLKAQKLAEKSGYEVKTIAADLELFDFGQDEYDGIISIFCHLPKPLRKKVHEQIQRSLRKGGVFIVESYSPDQLEYNSGGPKDKDWLVPLDEFLDDFPNFEVLHSLSTTRNVVEGAFHTGIAAVTQYVGKKI